jgi:hypothetical protein
MLENKQTVTLTTGDGTIATIGGGIIDGEQMFWIDTQYETVTLSLDNTKELVDAVKTVLPKKQRDVSIISGMHDRMKNYVLLYIAAKIEQDRHNDEMFDAVTALTGNNGHDFEPMAFGYYKFIEDTVRVIIGKENHEWVDWYLYDNILYNEGRHGGWVEFDGEKCDVTTPDMLVDICMDLTQFNQDFFKGKAK